MTDIWRPILALAFAVSFILAIGQCTDLIGAAWGSESLTRGASAAILKADSNKCLPLVVARVIDGDTLEGNGERIRIANIDTPETWRPQCDRERMLGLLATQRATQLIYSADRVEYCPDGRGYYDRVLATIRVDGQDLGEILVAENLAKPWRGKREGWCNE